MDVHIALMSAGGKTTTLSGHAETFTFKSNCG